MYLSDLIRPSSSPFPLVRLGGRGDGAYLIPDDLANIRACFSPGVNNTKKFEDDLSKKHGIKCHMCDYTSDEKDFSTPLIRGLQTFQKKWLEPIDSSNSISLSSWIKQEAGGSDDLILQMDIEGAEYRNLLELNDNLIKRFRIIVLELHDLYDSKATDEALSPSFQLLSRLRSSHVCVHAHPNNCCGQFIEVSTGRNIPHVVELTFLRKDRFAEAQDSNSFALLPNQKDISFNLYTKRPIHFNRKWLAENRRPFQGQVKIWYDYIVFSILFISHKCISSSPPLLQRIARKLMRFF